MASCQLSVAAGQEGGTPATDHQPPEEWETFRKRPDDWPPATDHWLTEYWTLRVARQKEIDASIAARAEFKVLYEKPCEDRSRVRVAGPFTVESISPHRVLGVDENGDVIDVIAEARNGYGTGYDFGQIILDNLQRPGVQQAHREDRSTFTSLTRWPGRFASASGNHSVACGQSLGDPGEEPDTGDRPQVTTAIFVGPEFGTGGHRRRVRCAHRLRLQLRRPHHRVREPGAGAGA